MIRKLCLAIDQRYPMLGSQVTILAGAAVSGAAQSMTMIIVGRCITGIGAAGVYQMSVG